MKTLLLRSQRATPEFLAKLDARGLLRLIRPSAEALAVAEGGQVVDRLELGQEGFGPWQMLAVACHRVRLDHLMAHSDAESWLYWSTNPASKPLLYVVATCPLAEFQAKAAGGTLEAADLIVLEVQPNDPATSFFTVPGGVPHDELTYSGPGVAPIFYVPEPSQMTHTIIDLSGYEISIERG